MAKPGTIGKFALVAAFGLAAAGCSPSPQATGNARTSDQNTVTVNSGMHVVNEYDRNLDRYADFMTNQLCEGKTGSSSALTCRNFEDLTGAPAAYVQDMGVLLHVQYPSAVRAGVREVSVDNIDINTASRVFNEYGSYYERYVDFRTELLCVSKTGTSSSPNCTPFSNMTQAQKDYVDYARREVDKASQPKPKS